MKSIIAILFILIVRQFNAQHRIQQYSVSDGLAQSQVYSMIEDSRGYIWMGTRGGGISRFDGNQFKNYNTANGLINNYILSLFEDDSGKIWIGTNDGISVFNGIKFENLRIQNLRNVMVSDIVQDSSGIFWIGSSNGIYTYDGKNFSHWSEKTGAFKTHIFDLLIDSKAEIWACSDKGVLNISGTNHIEYNNQDGLSNNHTRSIAETSTGYVIATFGGGVSYFDGNEFKVITDPFLAAHDVFVDKNSIWISTLENGVIGLNLKTMESINLTQVDGLSNNHTKLTIRDTWGNLWFATSGGGVNKYSGQEFETFTIDNGLKENYIYDVFKASNNDLWVSFSKGLTKINNDTIIHFEIDRGFKGGKSRVITEDKFGNIWIGTDGHSVFVFNGIDFHQLHRQDGIPHYWITDISFNKKRDTAFIGTSGGISIIPIKDSSRSYSNVITLKDELNIGKNANITAIRKTNNALWYGSRNRGVGCLIEGKTIKLNKDNNFDAHHIKTMEVDFKGNLWIGTEGQGVYILPKEEQQNPEKSRLLHVDIEDGLSSNNTYLISFDAMGFAYIGSEKGVDRLELSNNIELLDVKHFDNSNGFEGVETNKNAVCTDIKGNLWFGTIDGLIKYNPNNSSVNTTPPLLSFSGISLFYEDLESSRHSECVSDWFSQKETCVFNYDENHLSFDFKAINHKNPENVYYQYKLEGFEDNWSPISIRNSTTYSNIPPGEYSFKVIAGNEDDVWTPEPIVFNFQITPPFWMTWWFWILSSILTIGVASLIILTRINRFKRIEAEKTQRLKLEKEVLEVEQKALRLQMNPHFIFNSMNSVQALILKQDAKGARYYLTKFAKLMRKTLENSREKLVSIEEEVEILENYIDLENFGRKEKIDYQIKVDERLDPENVLVPPLLLQPFAENAIIHGFKGIKRQPVILIEFCLNKDVLVASIQDNGIGRKASSGLKSQIESSHKSTALEVTQERLAILNENEIKNGFEIIDLKDYKGNSTGTKVILRMKLIEEF